MNYPMSVRVDHVRRPHASTLLFSLARKAQRYEEEGKALEFFQGHLTGDGDYVAFMGWDQKG